VVAEDPFADLREASYDYAGLRMWALLGKTLFRPAAIFALRSMSEAGSGTRDDTIPCRHAERIYTAATGRKELWIVSGALHASPLGQDPAGHEKRVTAFFEDTDSISQTQTTKPL
jgi:fermentation-respiration switch protein FrsA (DUF1100 family)